MAHPGDTEIFCAGALARLQEIGFDIHIATMTPGDCGSKHQSPSDIARVRLEEARAAASRVRGGYSCLDCRDLQITYDPPTIRKAVELLRQVDPAIVITHSPQDYLLDHEITSLAVRNACFAAPVPNFHTGRLPGRPPTGGIPLDLYYASPAAEVTAYIQAQLKIQAPRVDDRRVDERGQRFRHLWGTGADPRSISTSPMSWV